MTIHNAIVGLLLASLVLGGCTAGVRMPLEPTDQLASRARISQPEQPLTSHGVEHVNISALQQDAEEVVASLQSNRDGEVYSAAVEGTNPDDLVVAVALADGRMFSAGNSSPRFPMMSVSKPFTYALAVEQRGAKFMLGRIGNSATGHPYNAVVAGAVRRTSEQNPMVNAGAIATHSYITGADSADKSRAVVALYSRMANQSLSIEESWRATPRAQTYTLAYQMKAVGRLAGNVEEAVHRYLEANIVAVDAGELAQMGATLASGGTQPVTGQRILKRETVRTVLAAMVVAGMYEESGRWWTEVGVPAKSGVSGAILAVVPGWGAIVAYHPRLDEVGNSVRGAMAIKQLVQRWNMHSMERLITGHPALSIQP